MTTMKFKMFSMVLKAHYVSKTDENAIQRAIAKYEASIYGVKRQTGGFDKKVLPKNLFPQDDEDKIAYDMAFAQLHSGEYERTYLIYNSKVEKDSARENAYPKEDRYAPKSNKERFAEEYHVRDNRIQTPEKFGDVDGYLHWFVSNAGPDVDVVHIDLNQECVQAYSVTDEYYKPVEHFKKVSPKTDAWSKAAGYDRKETIAFLMWAQSKRWSEKDKYAFVNSMAVNELGTTPDTQIVRCPDPDCGLPTVAAPASIGTVNESGQFVSEFPNSKQMTCQHCGADLSSCFDVDYSIPSERYLYKEQDGESDDIFESIAEMQTEIDIKDIDCEKVVAKAKARAKATTTIAKLWKPQKNEVTDKWAFTSVVPPLEEVYVKIRKLSKVRTLSSEEEARAAKWDAPIPIENRRAKVEKHATPGDTIEAIRKRQNTITEDKAFTGNNKNIKIMDSEVPADFPVTVIR